jgi:hypothetical protein
VAAAVKPEHVAAGLLAAGCVCAPAMAAEPLQQLADGNSAVTLAVSGSAAVAGLGALLVATDPQKRCVQLSWVCQHRCCGVLA